MQKLTKKQAMDIKAKGLQFFIFERQQKVQIEGGRFYQLTDKTRDILKAEQRAINIDSYQGLIDLGIVGIFWCGSENIYFYKNGVEYFTKLFNTDLFQPGLFDFKNYILNNKDIFQLG